MGTISEIHGWISLRYTHENSDEADDLGKWFLPGILHDIQKKIDELPFYSADVRIIDSYGESYVQLCGFRGIWRIIQVL